MAKQSQGSEKSPFWAALDDWGISQQEYIDTPVRELFMTVSSYIYKSKSQAPDSGIIIFSRNGKFGYSVAVWNSIRDGVRWSPCVQCKRFDTFAEAKEAATIKFLELAKSKKLTKWASDLLVALAEAPQQLSLF